LRIRLLVLCTFASACSLVVGTNKYVVGDEDAGDATLVEAGDDASPDAPVDAGYDAPCSNAGCLAEAGVCGSACGVTAANCMSNCTNTPCKNNCTTAETACRNACAATCNACTLSAGCEDKPACADAAAM
jgi:hypothetical protein